jgi:hypothetical protein
MNNENKDWGLDHELEPVFVGVPRTLYVVNDVDLKQ